MKSVVLAVALLASGQVTSPQQSPADSPASPYSGGDGSTKELAVVISAKDENAGVDAEYAWIRSNLSGATIESQGLVTGDRIYDRFEVTLPSGEKRNVYFDISGFFGKYQ